MSKKYLAYIILPVLGLALIGVGAASAHGWFGGFGMISNLTPDQITQLAQKQQTAFTNEANLLGLSIDDIKAAWAKGESLQQLAKDHNITAAQLKQKIATAKHCDL